MNRRVQIVGDELIQAKLEAKYYNLGQRWGKVALTLGVYPAYLADIRSGRRLPGPALLKALGMEKHVTIEYVEVAR
jgi:hypothetical protein